MNILEEICAYTSKRVEERSKVLPFGEVKRLALQQKGGAYAFENALKKSGLSIICEVKKASPSKGVIDPYFDYISIAKDFAAGGADCLSCLTEPHWFLGSDEIFEDIRKVISLPMLRKDFTVSEYQVYESALMGADAVLIIMEAVKPSDAERYFEIANTLGMSALFECRDEKQIECAQKIGAEVIGVNNRNLKDFSVSLNKAASLRSLVDGSRIFVSESGITSINDLKAQKQMGADACLIGEFCMRAKDRVALLREMKDV